MLVFSESDEPEIVGYADSNFAGSPDNMKTTSGYVFKLDGGAIQGKELSILLLRYPPNMESL